MTSREERFTAIAKEEATPAGYRKYAPIAKGRFVGLGAMMLLGLCVPVYVAWRLIHKQIASDTKA